MAQATILAAVVLVLGLTVLVVFVVHRLRLPGIVGFLLAGVLVGPHGLGLIQDSHDVEMLAEMGVVALLFTIGLEFSLQRLWEARRALLIAGPAQVLATGVVGVLLGRHLGLGWGSAVFVGFLVSLSSTAIVLSVLEENAEIHSPHGRTAVGVLIFQDVIAVPMMLLVPLLAGQAEGALAGLGGMAWRLLVVGVLVAILARWVVPLVLHRVTRTQDRQLFLMTVVLVVLGVAWVTSSMGLSLALGAFLAGIIIAESEYSQRALGSILPFRDMLTSFFFISMGMLLDVQAVLADPIPIVCMALALMTLKAAIAAAAAGLLGYPLRTLVMAGLSLSQVGEFSFILYQAGMQEKLLSQEMGNSFLAVSVVSLLLTPAAMLLGRRAGPVVGRLKVLPRRLRGEADSGSDADELGGHLVIIGYGFNGSNLAQVARAAGIPYTIVEMNPDTVLRERRRGEPIHYGDATQEPMLRHVGVDRARVVVIAISDAAATRRAAAMVRHVNPGVALLVRTRYAQDVEDLQRLGATEVIPEEYETALEIFARVLQRYLVPQADAEALLRRFRADSYQWLRAPSGAASGSLGALVHAVQVTPGVALSTVELCPDSPLVGETLAGAGVRAAYKVSVLAIRRGEEVIANPAPGERLQAGDALVVMGDDAGVGELSAACRRAMEGD